jgi:restriction system protein
MEATYPDVAETTLRIWTGEVWALKSRMRQGDLVCIPLKTQSAIAVGRIAGPYRFDASAPTDAKHQRAVEWITTELARTRIDQDILYSLGSSLAVFQVKRNNAEARLEELLKGRPSRSGNTANGDLDDENALLADLAQLANDQIVEFLGRRFKGHDLTRLIAGLLTAQGYKIYVSPPGADGGVDIIAGSGPMGFDPPRLAVQVKSSNDQSDVSVLRELQGVMPRFGADQGLIVSWGGYRRSVLQEARQLFFQVRLWDASDIVAALQRNYEALPDDLQAEIPLARVWTLVAD